VSHGGQHSAALLRRPRLGLELDELLGHVVGRPLGQYADHRGARLVRVDARAQGAPEHGRPPARQVPQLQHRRADQAVHPSEAVVLHRQLQLVAVGRLLPQQAAEEVTLLLLCAIFVFQFVIIIIIIIIIIQCNYNRWRESSNPIQKMYDGYIHTFHKVSWQTGQGC